MPYVSQETLLILYSLSLPWLFMKDLFESRQGLFWTLFRSIFIITKNGYQLRLWEIKMVLWLLKEGNEYNLYHVPVVIHSCFILHNFSEMRSENVNKKDEESIIMINNFNLIWKQTVKWMTMRLVVKWSGMFMLNKYFE